MAIVFALISALAYGVSDFLGGLFAKRVSPWQVAVVGQLSSTFFALIAGLFISGDPTASDWIWSGSAGFGAGFGAAFLYRGLSRGRMSVVAPISAIGSALVPVALGLITGDRPSLIVLAGVAFAFPAIYLISQVVETSPTAESSGVVDGVLAGLGFGVMFAMIGQVSDGSGLLPLALTQLVAVFAVILAAIALRTSWVPRDPLAWRAVVMGPLGITATGAFLYATHHGLLSVVSVIASLYPAGTVVLAAFVLREKIHGNQAIGLFLAAIAVALVAAG